MCAFNRHLVVCLPTSCCVGVSTCVVCLMCVCGCVTGCVCGSARRVVLYQLQTVKCTHTPPSISHTPHKSSDPYLHPLGTPFVHLLFRWPWSPGAPPSSPRPPSCGPHGRRCRHRGTGTSPGSPVSSCPPADSRWCGRRSVRGPARCPAPAFRCKSLCQSPSGRVPACASASARGEAPSDGLRPLSSFGRSPARWGRDWA